MTFSRKRHTVTYIVRIWAEYLDESPPHWRGVIDVVESGEQHSFATLKDVTEFIRRKTTEQIENKHQPK